MKTITIDFRKYPETPEISSNFELTGIQESAFNALPPLVDKLNLEVETDGHHLVINKATSQYYNPQTHEFSDKIPMTYEELDDMLYSGRYEFLIDEFLTNRIEE